MASRKETLLIELTKGKQLADQLKFQLLHPSSSSEGTLLLVEKILHSYMNALAQLDPKRRFEVAKSGEGSPKRRRTPKGGAEQATIVYRHAEDSPLDDGHTWRKYGQKGIMGHNCPRAYYRCTYSKSKGCLAVKHVQRCDNDPSMIEVNYIGKHTCNVGESSPSFHPAIIEEKPTTLDYGEGKVLSFPLLPIDVGDESTAEIAETKGSLGDRSAATTPTASESDFFGWSPSYIGDFGLAQNDFFTEMVPSAMCSDYTVNTEDFLDADQILLHTDPSYRV